MNENSYAIELMKSRMQIEEGIASGESVILEKNFVSGSSAKNFMKKMAKTIWTQPALLDATIWSNIEHFMILHSFKVNEKRPSKRTKKAIFKKLG